MKKLLLSLIMLGCGVFVGSYTFAFIYTFGDEQSGNNSTSRNALDAQKATWEASLPVGSTFLPFDFGTGTSSVVLADYHTVTFSGGNQLTISLRDWNDGLLGTLSTSPALMYFGSTMQGGAPRPQSLYSSSLPRYGYWNEFTNTAQGATSRNAILIEFSGAIDGFGTRVGDVETRTDGSGTAAQLILLDQSLTILDTQDIPTSTADQSLCGDPINGNYQGCGNRTSRWIGIENDAHEAIKYLLIVVGDDDATPGSDDGNTEHLSFIGGIVTPADQPESDVYVNKTVVSGNYVSGDIVSFIVSYGNNGPSTAENVILTDISGTGFVYGGSNPLWTGSLLSGETGIVVVTGIAVGLSGDITSNYATITTTTYDSNTGNNQSSDVLTLGCTDVDHDGYCDYDDCNDNDSEIHPGATELCDAIDNDCDLAIDEDFIDLGDLCSEGVGACQDEGIMVCNSAMTGTICNASPQSPHEETCDFIDNDCDGQIDENVCSQGGGGDSHCGDGEINQSREECDDGNRVNNDGCSAMCQLEEQLPICGNGIEELGEDCDGSQDCDSNCHFINIYDEEDSDSNEDKQVLPSTDEEHHIVPTKEKNIRSIDNDRHGNTPLILPSELPATGPWGRRDYMRRFINR